MLRHLRGKAEVWAWPPCGLAGVECFLSIPWLARVHSRPRKLQVQEEDLSWATQLHP